MSNERKSFCSLLTAHGSQPLGEDYDRITQSLRFQIYRATPLYMVGEERLLQAED